MVTCEETRAALVAAIEDAETNYETIVKEQLAMYPFDDTLINTHTHMLPTNTVSTDLSGTSAYGLAIAIKPWDSVKLYGNLKDVMVFDNPVPAATVKALYRATYIQ